MSWLDKIKNNLTITTGDGKTFTPNWLNATKQQEYNVSEFEFVELAGTLVKRGKPKGRKYNLELYFQGDNCIEDALAFELSAADPRAWTMQHPFYGVVIVQPVGLEFDNTKYNVSKITGMVIETIVEDSPKGTIDPINKIGFDKAALDEVFAEAFALRVNEPTTDDINILTENASKIYNLGLPSIKLDLDAQVYFNAFNVANAAILQLTSDVQAGIIQVQALINAPFQFINSVTIRIQTLVSQLNSLRDQIYNLSNVGSPKFNKHTKAGDEHNRGTIISAIAIAAVTQPDYRNRQEVDDTIGTILDAYNQYLADLDFFSSQNGGSVDSYIPDADSLIGLNNLINFTISNLFDVALNSKQERTLYCENDTNVITLAHRLYGLIVDDSTIETLIESNNITLFELLQIKKGRKIIWYV